jgi:hypothetical protein
MTSLTDLTTEYRTNPLGIDVPTPRFAWKLQTDQQGARQTSSRVTRDGPNRFWKEAFNVYYVGDAGRHLQRRYLLRHDTGLTGARLP